MHIAGNQIIKSGWPHVVELIGEDAKIFCNDTDANPNNAKTGLIVEGCKYPLKATIIDGDLPGYGIYVFAKTKVDAEHVKLFIGEETKKYCSNQT